MSQFGITSANSQPQVNNDNTIKNGDDKSNIILDKGTENLIKKETSLENTEKLKFGGRTDPKPESTMHKVGRYLTKILGGLCLVAGVAAAVAATVASCGIGGAVLAGAAAILTDRLREELGFEGAIITDALEMGAIRLHFGSAKAALAALQAGADLLLCPLNLQEAFDGILHAIADGRLSEERLDRSVTRILALKDRAKQNNLT